MRAAWCLIAILALAISPRVVRAADVPEPKILQTSDGIRFGLLGDRPAAPTPTLFLFATDIETTLKSQTYSQVGRALLPAGVLVVSVDVPGHGQDRRAGEPEGIAAWPGRALRDEELNASFAKRCTAVLDHLLAEKYTDAAHVAAAGTSRGGYMAMQFAAADPRVGAVVGFAPLTRPGAISEFAKSATEPRVEALTLTNIAVKLAGRSVWLTIGNDDDRVKTDECIAFARRLVDANKKGVSAVANVSPSELKLREQKVSDVAIEVLPSLGHRTPAGAHERAAAWLKERLTPEKK
jgi:dienelactone hydrolase